MASNRVTSNITAQTLFATPKHVVGRMSAINIDNQSAALRTLILQDIFTPDASVGVTSPTEKEVVRLQISVAAGQSVSVDKNTLEDLRFLGTAKVIGDTSSSVCVIVANYHFE